MQAEIAQEQWDDFKTIFAPLIQQQMMSDMDRGAIMSQLAQEQQRFDIDRANRYDDRYWGTQVPLEDSLIAEAQRYNSEDERERMAGDARADVEQAFAGSEQQMVRGLSRMGINPNSGRAFSGMRDVQLARAAAEANAMNKTRQAAKELGWAKTVDAAALGRGLPGFSGSASQAAQAWGAQGLNNMGMSAIGAGSGMFNSAAAGAGGLFGSASGNMRANAIEEAKNPGFDFLAGMGSGLLGAAGKAGGFGNLFG
ncbi:MAG: hypothetical protein WC972_02395 [Trueperaceae bacterium]